MTESSATLPMAPVVNRHTDVAETAAQTMAVVAPFPLVLPPVEWNSIGCTAPEQISLGGRDPNDPLPLADVVVLTWTSAEWFALDHVFVNSSLPGDFAKDFDWKQRWLPYTRGASAFSADPKSGPLWGSFQLVKIIDRSGRPWRVLLFKSNSHLAHPPWLTGLAAMLRSLLNDTRADRILTIGTAGGARLDQRLGDSVVTNAALLDLGRPQNTEDPDNGAIQRCATWYPATSALGEVESALLFKMNQVVTEQSLGQLLARLKTEHPDDPGVADLVLDDIVNDALNPSSLGAPKIQALKDVPLLTTDFFYIASGESADAYSFLEMDDAVIAREANRAGARFACVRNISDPIVPTRTQRDQPISAAVRADWSSLIYTSFGLFTSYNGALATWAIIAGEGSAAYDPARSDDTPVADDPLEVQLVFQVRSCGSCGFFWPQKKSEQPYGPYTAFDFDVNVPYAASPGEGSSPQPWVTGRTRPPAFPNGEVIDGCRKAPIMTIGINPNLTAFAPGQKGASWAYPDFSSDNGTDAWTKYAWYYRYRTVYQETLSLDFVKRFVLPEGQVVAARPGSVVEAPRLTDSPDWTVTVRYDGDPADTVLQLPGTIGDFPYVTLVDVDPPDNTFVAGDVIAGKLAVPQGIQVDVLQQQQGYYMQFVPVLQQLQETLREAGHPADLRIGEDVAQLDMVACASPHWNTGFLGGSPDGIAAIVDNCVSHNAWAIKQLVQTRPAILYIVSQSSWNMFHAAFGAHVRRDVPISADPVDKDFTLLSETTDPAHPAYVEFDVDINGVRYQQRTRLVITPHFSYNTYFLPQLRFPPETWLKLQQQHADCVAVMTAANGFTVLLPPPNNPNDYVVVQLSNDPPTTQSSLALLRTFVGAWAVMESCYHEPHRAMASVLDEMYANGELSWTDQDGGPGYLSRNEGSCHFCVNRHWQFPGECRYGKTQETSPQSGFLEQVAARIVANGTPTDPHDPAAFQLPGTPIFVKDST